VIPLAKPPGPFPRGPHGLTRRFVAQSQRDRMLLAMIETVAEKGYAAVSVKDVLERSGVSRRTFYEQFRNKEDCYLAAFDAAYEHLLARITEAYEAPQYWGAKAVGALGAALEFAADEPDVARFGLIEVMAAGDAARERYREGALQLMTMVGQAMEDSPYPPAVTEQAMLGSIDAIARIVTELAREGRAQELPGIRDTAAIIGLSIFIGPERAKDVVARAAAELGKDR
jgi:AcrR family transcriptional regulator